jgi:16S rRNA (uracil1498-N3)-methyltransferase
MTRRRWIADEVSAHQAALTGAHADHLIRVLRARIGQEFDIVVGDGVRCGRIGSISPGRVEFELGEEVPAACPPKITLLLAIFKFDRMEWAIEKCTELGVARVVPVVARRTDAHLASAATKRIERWRRIALQAAEQARRAMPPEIAASLQLQEAITLPASTRIVLAESEQQTQLRDVVESAQPGLMLAVGPEGGWSEEEMQFFQKERWIFASMGSTILRAETAAIAATAIAMSALS